MHYHVDRGCTDTLRPHRDPRAITLREVAEENASVCNSVTPGSPYVVSECECIPGEAAAYNLAEIEALLAAC